MQVNPMAFNAFNMWSDGQGAEILDYPERYDSFEGKETPDSVFYVQHAAYWMDDPSKFTGVPTEGAKVVNDVLEYPVKNGKQLKLKFTVPTPDLVHYDAVRHCKKQGLPHPTARELFDFWAAGVTEPNYGPNFKGGYPASARCASTKLWSASLWVGGRAFVWRFWYTNGVVLRDYRDAYHVGVRCVGSED